MPSLDEYVVVGNDYSTGERDPGQEPEVWEDIPEPELLLQDALAFFLPRWSAIRIRAARSRKLAAIMAEIEIPAERVAEIAHAAFQR